MQTSPLIHIQDASKGQTGISMEQKLAATALCMQLRANTGQTLTMFKS